MRLEGFILLLIAYFMATSQVQAQSNKDLEKLMPTEKVGFDIKVDLKENRPQRKEMKFIIMNSTKGTFYGNPCALTVTRKMGFEYAVQIPGAPGSMPGFRRRMHNFGVKSGLTLRRGPFWKGRLKRKLRDCGIKSGDRVG